MFEVPLPIKPVMAGDPNVTAREISTDGGLDLQRILSIVWRGKEIILGTIATSLLVTVIFVLVVPHSYTATTQILIDPTDLHAVGNELTPSNQANEATVLQVESQVRVLTSDSVLRRVVKAEGLDEDREFVGAATAASADPFAAALNGMRKKIWVKRAERTYVVDVSVTTREATKSARIANAIARAYLQEQTDVRSDAARQISQSLTARLNELKNRVRVAEDRVEAFKANNNILGASGQLVNEQQLTELNNQLTVARAATAAARARLDQVQQVQLSKNAGAFPEAVQSQTITALRSQYAEVMRHEAERTTSLGARHPAVIQVRAEAERLHHMIEDEVRRIALSARSEYESARTNEEALAAGLEKLKSNAVTTNEAMVTLRELERDVQANRAVYEAFLVRARETGEQERVDTKNIRVISPAEPPLYRSYPPSNKLLALAATLFGALAGTGIAFVREGHGLGLPHASGAVLEDAPQSLSATARPLSIPILARLPVPDASFAFDATENARLRLSQELHKVYQAIREGKRKRGNPSVLVVAADDEEDTIAVSLMLAAIAATSQNVVLIDADRDQRTLATVDGNQSDAGLIDVALGRREFRQVIVRDEETNINMVPLVSPQSRRAREIRDGDIERAFEQAKHFGVVIVAAIGTERNPGTDFFAGQVDHIILVTGADGRSDRAVETFVGGLGAPAVKIRGAVLTGTKLS